MAGDRIVRPGVLSPQAARSPGFHCVFVGRSQRRGARRFRTRICSNRPYTNTRRVLPFLWASELFLIRRPAAGYSTAVLLLELASQDRARCVIGYMSPEASTRIKPFPAGFTDVFTIRDRQPESKKEDSLSSGCFAYRRLRTLPVSLGSSFEVTRRALLRPLPVRGSKNKLQLTFLRI